MNISIAFCGDVLKCDFRFEHRESEKRGETDGGDYGERSSEACPHY